jgi:lipopolysaccharide export system protein LptA
VLQGGKGIYDSAEQIRIEEMALRVYSGDERMALEMTMDSPEATLLTAENRAVSEGPITIVGENFKVSGVGWSWNGQTKQIEVKFDVVVEFTQGMTGMLSSAPATAEETGLTEIHSRSLSLQTTAQAYRFIFKDSVHAVSGDMDLKSELLVAIADAPEGGGKRGAAVSGGKLDSIHQLTARQQVVIRQAGYLLKAGYAEFLLREQTAHFSGLPQIETDGAFLSGATIDSQDGKVVVKGDSAAGRAQMIVSQAGGLGILGSEAIRSETIVLSDQITLLESKAGSQFLFEGSVDVMSGSMRMRSNQLSLLADDSPVDSAAVAPQSALTDPALQSDPMLQFGIVKQVIASGHVRVEQENRLATADQVTFYPQEERADLLGSPRLERSDSVVVGDFMQLNPELSIVQGAAKLSANRGEMLVTGQRMELKPGIALVQGNANEQVKVVLPEMPDLGSGDLQALTLTSRQTNNATQSSSTERSRETVVFANTLRMVEQPGQTQFRFADEVSVSGTNLDATCTRLNVTAVPSKARKSGQTSESQLEVKLIEAFDRVVFKQAGRVATGDKAMIHPIEGKVVLEGDAIVTDEAGKVSGHRMTLLQGQRRAIVEGDSSTGKRATMTLPEMKLREQ